MATIRSMGSATISLSLVSAPAKIYAAVESDVGIHFNQLHAACGGRLKQQYVCPACAGQVVDRDQMAKGVEVEGGRYVVFTAAELKALGEEASGAIDIRQFVPAGAVDPIYYEKSYYLAPDKGGVKAFALIVEAMRRSGRHAVGQYSARGKQYVVLLRPVDGGLAMHQLRYADEVRPVVAVEPAAVDEGAIALAMQLVEQYGRDTFDPSEFKDGVRARIEEAVVKKAAGEAVPVVESRPAQVIDIMAALAASLKKKAA